MKMIRFYKNYTWEGISLVSFAAGLILLILLFLYGILILITQHGDAMELTTVLVRAKALWDLSTELIGATAVPALIGEILLIVSGIKRQNDTEK